MEESWLAAANVVDELAGVSCAVAVNGDDDELLPCPTRDKRSRVGGVEGEEETPVLANAVGEFAVVSCAALVVDCGELVDVVSFAALVVDCVGWWTSFPVQRSLSSWTWLWGLGQ